MTDQFLDDGDAHLRKPGIHPHSSEIGDAHRQAFSISNGEHGNKMMIFEEPLICAIFR
jgi:hypothetical protein